MNTYHMHLFYTTLFRSRDIGADSAANFGYPWAVASQVAELIPFDVAIDMRLSKMAFTGEEEEERRPIRRQSRKRIAQVKECGAEGYKARQQVVPLSHRTPIAFLWSGKNVQPDQSLLVSLNLQDIRR